ncbi:uncharacterized protein LOC6549601 [Drosophila erecta]|uniref:Uncharacterized protein n=1 Tax=Drosophila erecta TaxID=7220 RepID=B3NRI2_DROER|nr:uncharacterized protein LOC6549601 [Drosophila erecta]EDV56134.1 uncharacterized protein Dere_GG22475 [Drosophila erecta]
MQCTLRTPLLWRPTLSNLRITNGYSKDAKTLKRLGTSPRNVRDHPEGCTPQTLNTTAFSSPDFIPPSTYRIVDEKEQLGPKAGKKQTYKNPEYYSYYRYSYYDLKTIVDTIKKKQSTKK